MTRREKELFAMAIRAFDRQLPLSNAGRMTIVGRQLAENLTFKVTDAEIEAAVAVNLAGKGSRTAVRSKFQDKRLATQAARFRLIQDEDSHWYVIRSDQEDEFNEWQDAMSESAPWDGHDFSEDRVGGSPSRVEFPSFEIE
jgi:hypothetical protein